MSSRNSTHEDRSRRRKVVAVIVVALVLIVGWIVAIAALSGGGSNDSSGQGSGQSPGAEGGGQDQQQAAAPQGDSGGGQSAGTEPGSESGSSDSSGGPSEEELEEAAEQALSEPPGGGVPEGEVPIEDVEGRSNGQRGFVASFVGAAYGYTGKDVQQYHAGYESRIDTSTYYDSAGGAALEEYAKLAKDGGAENAAVLKEYRILNGEPVDSEVDAAAVREFAPEGVAEGQMPEGASLAEVTYAVGDRYGDPSKDEDFGKVYGDVDYLKQRLFLSREEGGWTILAASAPEPTEDPEANDPEPRAAKVMEPQGPHSHDHAGGQ